MSAGTSYNLEKMLKLRGQQPRDHFIRLAKDTNWTAPHSKRCLAWAPGSGKTKFSIHEIERILFTNPNARILVLGADEKILRDQFAKTMHELNAKHPFMFTFGEAKNSKNFIDLINNRNVTVALPQTVFRCMNKIPKLDVLIVDEAHEWLDAKTIQNLINKSKPTELWALTGTPENIIRFNEKNADNPYHIDFTTLLDLRKSGDACNIKAHIIQSSYDLTNVSGLGAWDGNGTIKTKYVSGKKKATNAVYNAIEQMLLKVDSTTMTDLRIPGLASINNMTKDAIAKLRNKILKNMKKGLWVCRSIKQSEYVYEILNTLLPGMVLISNSECDPLSINMTKFQNEKYLILVVVGRGRKGFDVPEMDYVVDMSLSKNISRIYQLVCRVCRVPSTGPNTTKHFFYVAPTDYVPYFTTIVRFALSLSHIDAISKYGGTNVLRIPIKVKKAPAHNHRKKRNGGGGGGMQVYDINDFPLDIDFWNYAYSTLDPNKDIQEIAWVTLDEIEWKLGYRTKQNHDDAYEILFMAMLCKNAEEFKINFPRLYGAVITPSQQLLSSIKEPIRDNNLLCWLRENAGWETSEFPNGFWKDFNNILNLAKNYKTEQEFLEAHVKSYSRKLRSGNIGQKFVASWMSYVDEKTGKKFLPLLKEEMGWPKINPASIEKMSATLSGRSKPIDETSIIKEHDEYVSRKGVMHGVISYLSKKFKHDRKTIREVIKKDVVK